MTGPIRWMARNGVAANLLMMVFMVGGLIMAYAIKQEVFPEVSLDSINITVSYPGAGPEEIEEGVLLKIEEAVSGISGVKEIKSVASEGSGTVFAEVLEGQDIDQVMQDVKAEVDRITTFPQDAERPVITKVINRSEVVSVVVYGDMPERSLREYAEAVRDDLLSMHEITQVELNGVRPYEISIEAAEGNLRRYGLTLDSIAARVRQASIDLPAGSIKAEGGEVLIRTKERRYRGDEYANITILQRPDGTEVKLGDIATIRDDFRETDEFSVFDGKPAAMVSIYRVGDQRPTDMSRLVKEYVDSKKSGLPDSVDLAIWNDTTEIFESRLNLLLKNAFFGLILVFLTLGLFLQIRLALWVMLAIPVAFLGALFLMPAFDVSINMLSLFAFILALGIVVDDAIVIGENVYSHRSMGKPYQKAAEDGSIEVAAPVIFSVLTTIAAFSPLIFLTGMMGKFIKVIPLVVIPILAVSLIESLFILPSHLAIGKKIDSTTGIAGFLDRVRLNFGARLERFITGPYRSALSFCIRLRYITVASAVALLLASIGLIAGGVVKFQFMPVVDGDIIMTALQMPPGTPVNETKKIQEFIIRKGDETVAEFDTAGKENTTVLRNTYSIVGKNLGMGRGGIESTAGAHLASSIMFLTESEKRGVPAENISRKWRDKVGDIPGADSLTFTSSLVHFGANIDLRIAHENTAVLGRAAAQLKQALTTYPGVSDISDNFRQGKQELKLRLTPEARTLGITEEELGKQIRAAFFGSEALRLQRGRNELRVMVRYPEEERKYVADLYTMRIRTRNGDEVPFSRAAYIEEGRGYSSINRADRKRVVNVTASVDADLANAQDILLDLDNTVLKQLAADYPGLTFNMEGEEKERKESMGSMMRGFGFALFMIYALLAVPFRSYTQPLIIMSSIPFGIVGAVLGHMIMGFDLSILSMFGIVALSGVVVNNALLLIDFINRSREEENDLYTAVIDSGQRRFRPILLTSLTTAFGLAPMIFETSVQAQFLIPMAISLAFGVLFATGITLLLIPSLYLILEDIKGLLKPGYPI
jgi:multidrug efflux pump subunit AcrB